MSRVRRGRAFVYASLAAVVLGLSIPARAQSPSQSSADTGTGVSVRTSIKGSALLFHAPDAPVFFPDQNVGESLWRMRIEPTIVASSRTTFELAYEHRLAATSSSAGLTTLGVLPQSGEAPYRIRQLDWAISTSTGHVWRHEIDRASAHIKTARADFTLGRQAIGWGRGVLFGAVDLFAPFSPLEADREWRRGVDAARAEFKFSDQGSVEGVGAFGPTWDRSLVGARVRGYRGDVDVEAVGGRRARDLFAGVTTSASVGDAELHGETAVFHLPEPLPRSDARTVWKAVAGGSYRLAIGSGVMVFAEYHYSGFGARTPADIVPMLADPSFAERYIRGDTQILLRHATGMLASYEQSPTLSYSGQWIETPTDGSGVLTPAVTITFNDRLSLYLAGYLPYGKPPVGAAFQSAYGVTPAALFSQARLYF